MAHLRLEPTCRRGGLLLLALALGAVGVRGQTFQFSERGTTMQFPDSVGDVAVGDVDGDGDIDAVTWGNRLRLFLNDGRGGLRDANIQPQLYNQGGRVIALGDLDGDSDLDLVVGKTNSLFVYLNDGSGGLTNISGSSGFGSGHSTWSVDLVDVDRDGDLDILAGSSDSGGNSSKQNQLFLNDGRARFTDVTATHLPVELHSTVDMAVGDVDGDGDPDVVVANLDMLPSGVNRLHLNDGTGRFTDATASRMPATQPAMGRVALGDVDSDGDLDLLCTAASQSPPFNLLYLNDGTGRFTDVTSTHMPANQNPVFVLVQLDADLDGDLDLVGAGTTWPTGSHPDTLFLNDGRGRFTDATGRIQPFFSAPTRELAAADLDGDGDADLLAVATTSGTPRTSYFRLLTNLYRHVEARAAPRIGQTFVLDLFATPGFGTGIQLAVPWLGARPASPPVTIPPFGTFRLDPSTLFAGPPTIIQPATGQASLSVPVPNDPRLVGRAFYAQAGFLHSTSPADWRFSNLVRAIVQ